MRKHLALITLFVGATLLIIFAASGKILDFQNSNFLAAISFQNVVSPQGTASSTSGTASAATSTPTLADALQQFQDQIRSLNNQMADLRSKIEITNLRSIFTRTLRRGDTGDDVSKLQELLTRFPEFYSSDIDASSTVTGFYGSLTRAAVMQLQSQTGLGETGVFDSDTREKFYETISALTQESTSTEFTPIDVSAIDNLKKIDGSANQTPASVETSITDLQNQVSQLSSDLANANTEIADLQNQLAALQPTPPPTPSPAPSPTPSPSPTSPPPAPLAISNIQVTQIAQHSATATWTTNSPATSEVDYSTDATMSASKTIIVNNSTAVTNHTVGLQNLNSETKYYYRVLSKDSSNKTASSTIQNFNTLH